MKKLVQLLSLSIFISLLTAQSKKPSAQTAILDVRQMMTAAEFNKAGLQKLTPDEIGALNQWLYSYSVRLLVSSAEPAPSSASVIETQIEGDFDGWDGETIFKMDNGQIWQQDSYAYTYHYAYRPKVVIYKTGTRYKLRVEGVEDTIYVKRLK